MESFSAGGLLDGRGLLVDEELLAFILAAAPRGSGDRPTLEHVDFSRAVFAERAKLAGVAFGSEALFVDATFGDKSTFADASFGNRASFVRAVFGARMDFSRAVFDHEARFAYASFGDDARFTNARFGDRTRFLSGVRFGERASFAGATFGDQALFDQATFGNSASFRKATFGSDASFRKSVFGDEANFELASFGREASFSTSAFGKLARFADAKFAGRVSLRRVAFGEDASFRRVTFAARAQFANARFDRKASFSEATFRGGARFALADFSTDADFDQATFTGQVSFDRATFQGRASFRLATFEHARNFGPVVVHGLLVLDETSFLRAANVQVSALQLSAARAVFPDGIDLRVRWAEIALDLAKFGAPSVLSASKRFPGVDEQNLPEQLQLSDERPQIVSLRGANVADLVLADVRLDTCRIVGAHNLDQLRLEGETSFADAPWTGGARRQVIVEEQEWRASRRKRPAGRWHPPAFTFPLQRLPAVESLDPAEIASVYRGLRKGREDGRDAPGAADFYYGEMEMRRHDTKTRWSDRVILWLYWLVSGYGLRGMRALSALVLTTAVFALLFWRFGFAPRAGLIRSSLFSAESTSGLFRAPTLTGTSPTRVGEALQLVLRLLGPLFFGLAIFSLRARVKR